MNSNKIKGIAQYLIVGSDEVIQAVESLSARLQEIGITKGEFSKNENLQRTLQTLYRDMFPQQNFTEQEEKDFPNRKPLVSKYNYSEFEVLVVFIKSYSSGHPCRILTHEVHPRFTVGINSNILWLMRNDHNLKNIVKLFFIDASAYPPRANDTLKEPPLLQFILPPECGKILIGFVTKNDNKNAANSTMFFARVVEELEKRSYTSFREMFENVRQSLEKEQIYVDCLDKLGVECCKN